MIVSDNQRILYFFPSLAADKDYKITSPATRNYNCISWALGRTDYWYWPYLSGLQHEEDEFWPENVPNSASIDAFIKAMEFEGFEVCSDYEQEEHYTKIALYESQGDCTHASRQLPTGLWTSKIGPLNDIQHTSPYDIEGKWYGKVYCFMRRKQ